MTPIPTRVRKEIASDPSYRVCKLAGLHGHVCGGRITMEHAMIYAGHQIQEKWAIVSICAAGQEVDRYQDAHTMNKELNRWVALNQATDDHLRTFTKANYIWERDRLNAKYGVWVMPLPSPFNETEIHYSFNY